MTAAATELTVFILELAPLDKLDLATCPLRKKEKEKETARNAGDRNDGDRKQREKGT